MRRQPFPPSPLRSSGIPARYPEPPSPPSTEALDPQLLGIRLRDLGFLRFGFGVSGTHDAVQGLFSNPKP